MLNSPFAVINVSQVLVIDRAQLISIYLSPFHGNTSQQCQQGISDFISDPQQFTHAES